MCGIVGFAGRTAAVPHLVSGLTRLEYRGYDSAGVAVIEHGDLFVEKSVGRLSALHDRLRSHTSAGTIGIGHTRWATHGEPSERNAHPHLDGSGRLAVVHNGIIENYMELREELEAAGHRFLSETDTEVLPHLIEEEQRKVGGGVEDALRRALARVRGAYALGVLSADEPDRLFAVRQGSPLVVALGPEGMFIASDVPAVLGKAHEAVYLRDGEMAVLTADSVEVRGPDGKPVEPDRHPIEGSAEAAERAGFETFMLKEIHEQPRVLRAMLQRHVAEDGRLHLPDVALSSDYFQILRRIMIVSCGTAYHAALYGKLLIENLTGLAVETDLGSEFRYRSPRIERDTLVIAVSQSGETADTLASIRLAREMKCKVLSICNVRGSSLVRESDAVLFTEAGPEIGVASTKAYTAQLMAFALLATHVGLCRGEIAEAAAARLLSGLAEVPDAIHYMLDRSRAIRAVAENHQGGPSSLYLGRKYNFPTALEGALKNKEISYQHAEGYAAGEMKHGPIALINEYMPVVCICTRTRDEVYEKMLSNVREVEARHGRIIALVTDGDEAAFRMAEDVISVPAVADEWTPMVAVVGLQLLAYYAARARGTDIDKPRNLAKSVTVE